MFDLKQFILAKVMETDDRGKTKVPCDKHGRAIDPHNPQYWMTYEEVKALRKDNPHLKMGFVLTANDPYFCIDIDGAYDPITRNWSQLTYDILAQFPGSYQEVSQSQTGLHIFGRYTEIPTHANKNVQLNVELYHEKRFIMLADEFQGDPDLDFTENLSAFIAGYMPQHTSSTAQEWTTEPVAEWGGYVDDDELIEKALTHKPAGSVFNDAAVLFKDLWENNEEQIAKKWPSETDTYDRSSADLSLAQRLAFYTGKNCQRIYDLMWKSRLVRDKWHARPEYVTATILKACSQQTKVYTSNKPNAKGGIERKMAGGYVGTDELPEFFEGCYYIMNRKEVYTAEFNDYCDKGKFDMVYAGYTFALTDSKNTDSPWKACRGSPTFGIPLVTRAVFRPDLPPLELIEDGDEVLLNTYRPINIGAVEGDVKRFLKVVNANFPDEHDRNILLSYMAAVVQYPGKKFQWAPLIQGPEGNGKTFLLQCMNNAIGRRYIHTVNAQELGDSGSKFNSWMDSKLFISVEEIRVGNKHDIMEALKPLIGQNFIEIQAKGRDQYTIDNYANFMFTSNYMDALALNDDQRRFCPLMSAPQSKKEIEEAGLTPEFFKDLWDWAKGEGAYAGYLPGWQCITHYLRTYDIQEAYNPAGLCIRAPRSTHYNRFASYSLGRVEQDVMEAIDQGRVGFRGGYISSTALENLLKESRLATKITHARRRDILENLGFVPHPHLKDGRVSTVVMPDGNKPKLFIPRNSVNANITSPKLIAQHYSEAQRNDQNAPQQNVVSLIR